MNQSRRRRRLSYSQRQQQSWWLVALFLLASTQQPQEVGGFVPAIPAPGGSNSLPPLLRRIKASSERGGPIHPILPTSQQHAITTRFRETLPTTTHQRLHASTPQQQDQNALKNNNGGNNDDKESFWDKLFRPFVRWLAELSLEDYQWRVNVFKDNEADRLVEQSLARLRGENATYVRPMDAQVLGPLGRWEQTTVSWLLSVMEEEYRRAQRIVENAGKLIRPSDNVVEEDRGSEEDKEGTSPDGGDVVVVHLGPLGTFEKNVVDFFKTIRRSEEYRVRTKTLRPKDVDEGFRGPLGELEYRITKLWEDIRESERLRARLQSNNKNNVVRPIDVPGPLGEWELKFSEIFQAESRRAQERQTNPEGKLVRPKDAKYQGPLGKAELSAFETIQSLSQEEMERLKSIQKSLQENRPMDNNRESFLGNAEALLVGILRGPALLVQVWTRVTELLQSQKLDENDKDVLLLRQQEKKKKKDD